MANRPYVVEVCHEIDYLKQVIQEIRWQHGAAHNASRLMENAYELLVAKCKIVTFHKNKYGGSAYFPFDLTNRKHKLGPAYTLRVMEWETHLMDWESVKVEHNSPSWVEMTAPPLVRMSPLENLTPQELLGAIQELSIREIMSM